MPLISWFLVACVQVNCETLVVGQTKKYVQQACEEWTARISYKKLEIVDLDTPDPSYQPPLLPAWRPTVVTAFSRNHFKHGLLLLRSLGNTASNPTVSKKYSVSMVVWTMDEFNEVEKKYLDCVIQEVKEVGVEAEVRRFPFEKYPTWMRLNASLISNQDGGKGALHSENLDVKIKSACFYQLELLFKDNGNFDFELVLYDFDIFHLCSKFYILHIQFPC